MYTSQGVNNQDELVEKHTPLVKRIAYHLVGRLPPSVAVDDLIQAGLIGLLDAANQYDPSQGASFETYASIRVRGAMLDELRRNDWAPKSVHRRSRELSEAIHRVESATGREAADKEVADELGISLDEYFLLLQESSTSRMVSLDELSEGTNGITTGTVVRETPAEQVQQDDFRKRLGQEIARLPERERLVMALYYDRELNLKEIGLVLKVSESRVSQILSQAHARLRARMSD